MKKKNCMFLLGINTTEQMESEYSKRMFQEEILKKFAMSNEYNIVGTIIHDRSIKSQSTNELLQLLDKMQDQFDIVLFTRWDRLSRNSHTIQIILKKLIELKKEYQAVEQPLYFDSPECKLIFEILLTISNVE